MSKKQCGGENSAKGNRTQKNAKINFSPEKKGAAKTKASLKKTYSRRKKKDFVLDFVKVRAAVLIIIIISALIFFLTPPKNGKEKVEIKSEGAEVRETLRELSDAVPKKENVKPKEGKFDAEKVKNSDAEKISRETIEDKRLGKTSTAGKQGIRKTPSVEKNAIEEKMQTEKNDSVVRSLPELPILKKGVLFFVFDDAGHNTRQLQYFLDLPFKCTVAVLPCLPMSKECAELTRLAGKEVILHQPMQAENLSIDPGDGAVKKGMDAAEIKKIVKENIEEIAPIAGMNNHEGSLITADEYAMSAVLEAVQEKGIFFLDSKTTARSAAAKVAAAKNMRIFERDVFLDNEKDAEYMRAQIIAGLEIAQKQGQAVMIGHVFTVELAKILSEMYYELEKEGYEFSVLSEYY